MNVIKKALSYIQYRIKMKVAVKQLKSCMKTYQKNEKIIMEIEELLKQDAAEHALKS